VRVFDAKSCVTSRDEFVWQKRRQWCLTQKERTPMLQKLMRISFCSLAFSLLTAGTFGALSLAATVFQDNSNQSQTKPRKHLHATSTKRQTATTQGNKHGQRTIIFVGGKEESQGAATRSNPTAARKSNGTLNPQPIPPGKSRRHPPGPCRKGQGTPCS